jgi:hypothetical protein
MSKFLIMLLFLVTWANVCVCGTSSLHRSQTIWRQRDPLLKFRSGVWHLSHLSEMSNGKSRKKSKEEEEEEEAERKRVYERYRMSSNDGSSFLRDFHTYRF